MTTTGITVLRLLKPLLNLKKLCPHMVCLANRNANWRKMFTNAAQTDLELGQSSKKVTSAPLERVMTTETGS
ncbi:unnamed protein product, partial [Allacma fusca]